MYRRRGRGACEESRVVARRRAGRSVGVAQEIAANIAQKIGFASEFKDMTRRRNLCFDLICCVHRFDT
jgi:hypothetical protein